MPPNGVKVELARSSAFERVTFGAPILFLPPMSADRSSPPGDDRPTSPSDLQFDTAESHQSSGGSGVDPHAALTLTCAHCNTEITTSYYEVNNVVVCPRCRSALDAGENSPRWQRSLKA